jgi:Cu2+-exporting ATPase
MSNVIGQMSDVNILRLAAAVESRSEHPAALAVVGEAQRKNFVIPEAKDFERIPGRGVKGKVNGAEVFVGGEAILAVVNVGVSDELKSKISELAKQGKTIIYVIAEKKLIGALALADIIRDESREAIAKLQQEEVKVAMITGDSEDVAKWVAVELGIDEYFARVLPREKADKVKLLQQRGQKVAMVGDGVNDAPALMQADLGIAIGAGTNVAIESAGIILARNDPRDIPKIIALSRATYKKMIQNLFWATGYNIVALPLAAGVLAAQGILLQPALAALFMSISTVIVAFNAVLLRRQKI